MTRPTPGSRLTPQQHKILHLISHGYSNGAIARQLWLSEDTIKTHIRRIFHVLRANDRAHATRRGFEEHLLATEELVVHDRRRHRRVEAS